MGRRGNSVLPAISSPSHPRLLPFIAAAQTQEPQHSTRVSGDQMKIILAIILVLACVSASAQHNEIVARATGMYSERTVGGFVGDSQAIWQSNRNSFGGGVEYARTWKANSFGGGYAYTPTNSLLTDMGKHWAIQWKLQRKASKDSCPALPYYLESELGRYRSHPAD